MVLIYDIRGFMGELNSLCFKKTLSDKTIRAFCFLSNISWWLLLDSTLNSEHLLHVKKNPEIY